MYQLEQTKKHHKLSLGHAFIVSGLFLFLMLSVLLSAASSLPAAAFGTSVISDLSNSARSSNGVQSLAINSQLTSAAQAKADAMVANDYFEHTAPDGKTGWDYIAATGYSYSYAGENLAASNQDDSAVVNGWLNSSTHRENLLSTTYTEVGYGIAYQGDFSGYSNVYFIVALYAKPQTIEVVNPPPAAEKQVAVAQEETAPTQEATSNQATTPEPEAAPQATEPPQTSSTESETSSSGTVTASKQPLSVNNNLSLGVISLGTGLSVSGIALEGQRIARYFRSKH